jgi:hypothetical protein
MSSVLKAALLTVACTLASSGAALAQACPEGRAANGECVRDGMSTFMTQSAVIYSQPKISQTHYPILPALDWIFRYPHQVNPNPLTPSAPGTLIPPTPPSP